MTLCECESDYHRQLEREVQRLEERWQSAQADSGRDIESQAEHTARQRPDVQRLLAEMQQVQVCSCTKPWNGHNMR